MSEGELTAEQKWAQEALQGFQQDRNAIAQQRNAVSTEIRHAIDGWADNMATISFGLGGALIGVGAAIKFDEAHRDHQFAFWVGAALLVLNGTWMIWNRLHRIETDATKLAGMGFEKEYYLSIMQHELTSRLRTGVYDSQRLRDAQKALNNVNPVSEADIDKEKVDVRADWCLTIMLTAFGFLAISALPFDLAGSAWLVTIDWLAIMAFFLFFRMRSPEARLALEDRKKWQKKLLQERKDWSGRQK